MKQSISFAYSVVVYDNYGETLHTFEDEKRAKKFMKQLIAKEKLDDQGIVHGIRGVGDLDEASGAYKDIGAVMENERDLVKPLVRLTPLGVIKG